MRVPEQMFFVPAIIFVFAGSTRKRYAVVVKGLKPQQHTQGPLLQILWAFRGQRPARDGYSHSPTRANNVQGKSRTVQGFAQFSTFSPATRLNSRSLLVTRIHPSALAWAAIHRSLLPIV